jgi:hypothetical protein
VVVNADKGVWLELCGWAWNGRGCQLVLHRPTL